MSAKMTRERAEEFGAAWNSGDADLVAGFFAEDGVYHASVGPDALGKSYFGKEQIRRGVQAFFDRFPGGAPPETKVVADGKGALEGPRYPRSALAASKRFNAGLNFASTA